MKEAQKLINAKGKDKASVPEELREKSSAELKKIFQDCVKHPENYSSDVQGFWVRVTLESDRARNEAKQTIKSNSADKLTQKFDNTVKNNLDGASKAIVKREIYSLQQGEHNEHKQHKHDNLSGSIGLNAAATALALSKVGERLAHEGQQQEPIEKAGNVSLGI